MKNNDFDFIASKFEDENISAPDSLSVEKIKEKIEKGTDDEKIIKLNSGKKRFIKGAISVAAAIALVVVSLTAVNYYNKDRVDNKNNTPKTSVKSEDLIYFTSHDEIDNLMKDRLEEQKTKFGILRDYQVKSSDGVISNETKAVGAAPSHSETYKQIDSVDEADIVKTDGEYIYFISDYKPIINIYSAKDGKTEKVSEIKLKNSQNPSEMFIKENRLIVISTRDKYIKKRDLFTSKTIVQTYNIEDKSNPKKEYEYSQSGFYASSRMISDFVYVISNNSYNYYVKNDCIPYCTGDDGKYKKIPAKDICAIKDSEGGNYTVIGAVDITNGNKAKKTKAVIGSVSEVYCNESNLYIAGVRYNFSMERELAKTTIIKCSLDKTNINITATGKIKGNINNQFSMDEKDGYFRIATTTQNKEDKDINILYVLDENLDVVGKVNSFAKNEHIEAVRFIGDMAYVITYERTDPLFIIDLSNPENPEILGEVKISGFSTMLVPIDEKTLLGIGYSTEENEFGEATNGLKLALFDIGNPAKPKVIGEKELIGVDSPAQYSHKALVQNSDEGYFAIPCSYYNEETEEYGEGALAFSVKNGKIEVNKKFVSDEIEQCQRCVYIGNFIYALDTYEGIIDSFSLK
ncbi:MAG: beta-propeller domain-containing protein [Eubacterium sp.]|nr:beta-propeller domain-containing protein [Eubacterium sp.]